MAAVCLSSSSRQRKKRKHLVMAAAVYLLVIRRDYRCQKSIWTRQWLLRRDERGAYETLCSELREEDQGSFLNFFRMSPGLFDDLLTKVEPLISRRDTTFRKAVSAGLRLAVTLRYLATGQTYRSLSYLFRVGNNTIGRIVPETCMAIHAVLKDDYFKCPTTPKEWEEVAKDYWTRWNFPNCVGSLDGKHVVIRQPACSGSKFFNYKHSFSIILLALVDAQYRFLFCDVGSQGRCSDAGVYAESHLKATLSNNTLGLPEPSYLPGTQQLFPYCIVGDDAFPLKSFLMKPYPHRNLSHQQRIYNYRLSRARRCVENAFGIMSSRFRVLLSPICLAPQKVDHVILACCVLHNMLRTLSPNSYVPTTDNQVEATVASRPGPAQIQQHLPPARVSGRRSATNDAKANRDLLCHYFSNSGAVNWQESMI